MTETFYPRIRIQKQPAKPRIRLRVLPKVPPQEISLQATDSEIQWKLGAGDWQNLLPFSDIDASVGVGTVETLAAGSDATVTNSGTDRDAVLDFGIPKGDAATISVGTVTTGAEGSDATVTNSGTSGAAVLDFSIPVGATGATGPQGPQGDVKDADLGTPTAINLANATGLTIAGGGTGAAAADAARLGLVLPTYVADLTALGALDTSNDVLAFNQDGGHAAWFKLLTGDQSAIVTADPLHLWSQPPSGDTTGASGVWVDPDALPVAGFWTDIHPGFPIKRFGNRVFIGAAIKNDGALTNNADGKDWLTADGYATGIVGTAQVAVGSTIGQVAILAFSRNSDIAQATSAIAYAGVVEHDTSYDDPNGAWVSYFDLLRKSGAGGFSNVIEADISNHDAVVKVDPYSLPQGATLGINLNSVGADPDSASALSPSVALYIQGGGTDHPRWESGIIFTDTAFVAQSDGFGDAINLAAAQAIRWYSAASTRGAWISQPAGGALQAYAPGFEILAQDSGTPYFKVNPDNSIDIGDPTAASNNSIAYIDFHSATATSDYSARILSSGGDGTSGSADMTITAAGFKFATSSLGFFSTTPVAKSTVSGSKGSNAALASLMTALSSYGLVTDSTT